jgi:hypothetical protein
MASSGRNLTPGRGGERASFQEATENYKKLLRNEKHEQIVLVKPRSTAIRLSPPKPGLLGRGKTDVGNDSRRRR